MIIEIPDDNSIIKWKINDSDEWKSAEILDLINAYKERPQGELIGRDALKEEFNLIASKSATGEWFSIPIKYIKQIIDNATPVEQEVYMHGEDYNFFIRGYKEGRKAFAQPKGEWIQMRNEEGIDIYRRILCSHCNKVSAEKSSFCPNCGADMRKGSVDNNSCCNCYWNCSGTCKNEQSGYYKMSIKSVMGIPPYKHCSKYEAYEGDG